MGAVPIGKGCGWGLVNQDLIPLDFYLVKFLIASLQYKNNKYYRWEKNTLHSSMVNILLYSTNTFASNVSKVYINHWLDDAGSFDQSPNLSDVLCGWAESNLVRQPRSSEEEEDRLRETLADAMVESPVKDCGPTSMREGELPWFKQFQIFS